MVVQYSETYVGFQITGLNMVTDTERANENFVK